MENPPGPLSNAPNAGAFREPSPLRTAGGIWSLEDDHLASIEQFGSDLSVVLVRTEHVLIITAQLPPIASMARRRAALPFAIEDRIAEPLDEVHVALGAEVAPHTFIVGVVRHELMRQWVLRLAEAGLDRAALVPDALSLPVPGPDTWSVDLAGERAMVRLPDGTGFAMPLALFTSAWEANGKPHAIAYGDTLPPQMEAARTELEVEPLAHRLLVPALDLRQGPYARPRKPVDPLWRRIAFVTATGALAHATIATGDTLALSHIAGERETEVRALAATVQPSLVLDPELSTTVKSLAPASQATAAPSQFLILIDRTGAALTAVDIPVLWRSVAFDQAVGTLTIAVETSDIAGLQRVLQALTAAGLTVQPGAATTDQGSAIGSFTVLAG